MLDASAPETSLPEASTGAQDASPTQGSGTCAAPQCAADANGNCGCQASANGSDYYMGCQAGGQCACVAAGQVTNAGFAENGACNSVSSMQQQFINNCPCP
jgi:hypothetical protein